MSIIFTRHGNTGRADTPQQPARQTVITPIKPAAGMANLVAAMPKTIAEFIKAYGQKEWEKFRDTILSTPTTIAYLQAADAHAKAAALNTLLVTEYEIGKRVIDKWKEQLALQTKAQTDGLSFIAERWGALALAAQHFTAAITGIFVGTPAQMQEQLQGVKVYWGVKKFAPAGQYTDSPLGKIPVGEMNDPVGKIKIPPVAAQLFAVNTSEFGKAVGGQLADPLPGFVNPKPMLPFLQWAAKQGSVLFRRDVADWWDECGMPGALAAFADAVQGRVILANNTVGLQNAISNNTAFLAGELTKQIKASEKATVDAQNAALAALSKVASGVPAECATATAAVNFELAMASALLQATAKLNEAVKAGLTNTDNLIYEMEKLQAKLAAANTAAEKELIAAQIIALGSAGAADANRINSRLNDRKGKMGAADDRAKKAIAIADAHGLDGSAARQAANILIEQSKAADALNTAHTKTLEEDKDKIAEIIVEVLPDAGSGGQAAGADVIEIVGGGSGSGSGESGGSGALWLIVAAAAAKFFM
jgi:hypothetical protein